MIPRLFACEKPRLRQVTTRACGNSSSTSSRVPSVDSLSATTTSSAIGPACSNTLVRQGRSQSASLVETMMIARSCISAREAARHELPGRRVDAVVGFLAGEPLDECGHALFEPDRGAKAQQLLRPGDVRVAVADVAGAITARALRL